MTPSRLYHRRPACVLVSAPTATLASQGQKGLLLVRCKPRLASTIPLRKSGSYVRRFWRSKLAPRGNTGGTPMLLWTNCRACLLAEGAALPPLTCCVIPPLPSSKCPNSSHVL